MLAKYLKRIGLLLIILLCYPYGYYVLTPGPSLEIGNGKTGIYLINLARSTKRLEYVRPNIEALNLPWQRIEAVDGKMLSEEKISSILDSKQYIIYQGSYPNRGTLGCSLSHIKAWQKFLGTNDSYAIIMEDDITFQPFKLKKVLQELASMPDVWDIVNLELSHNGLPLRLRHLPENDLSIYLTEVTHAGAYLLNRKAAHILLEKALPIKMPIDHYFTRSWEFGLKFTGIEKPRLISQQFGDSEINNTHKINQRQLSTIQNFQRGIFKIQSYIARFAYNLKIYFLLIRK